MIPKFTPSESCHVIDLDLDYSKQKILYYVSGEGNSKGPVLHWFNFPDEPTTVPYEDYSGNLFPDIFLSNNELDPYYEDLRKKVNKIRQELYDYVYRNKVFLSDFLTKLIALVGISSVEAEAILKLELARHLNFRFESLKTGDFIRLSEIRHKHEDKKRFLSAITDELQSNSNRVELLIQHNQTKGNYRELLLRNVLRKYIPQKFEVSTGFIEGCPRQIDILIYDAHNYSPFFKEQELVVVPIKAVRAVIEVKTTLQTDTLQESLALLDEVTRFRTGTVPFFKGIFAFETNYKQAKSIATAVKDHYNAVDSVMKQPKEIMELFCIIDAIAVQGSFFLMTDLLDYQREDRTIRPRIYSANSEQPGINVAGSCFFSKLFSYLEVDSIAKRQNNTYFDALDQKILYKLEEDLTSKDWKPRSCFKNEHDFTDSGIIKRVVDVIQWMQGFKTINELEQQYFSELYSGFDPEEFFKS